MNKGYFGIGDKEILRFFFLEEVGYLRNLYRGVGGGGQRSKILGREIFGCGYREDLSLGGQSLIFIGKGELGERVFEIKGKKDLE